jgi:hypothetical protein
VAHTVASAMSGGKDRPKFMDYLLSWAPRKRQTGEEQLQIFKALASGGGES